VGSVILLLPVRPVRPAVRLLFAVFTVMGTLAFVTLYLLPANTATTFAWTIDPPVTAAFLGAGFGGALFLFALGLRERVWANARMALGGPLALSVFTLAATLMHLDRFHFGACCLVPRTGAWIWLVVYAIVPLWLVAVLILQQRSPGMDPPREQPIPASGRFVLVTLATVLISYGLALFAAPAAVGPSWPWDLTPLTARAVAAWLIAIGVTAAQAALVEADFRRTRSSASAYALVAVLYLIGMLIFADQVRWTSPGGIILVAVLLAVIAAGVTSARVASPE
jgi:hypothetical protein